MLELLFSIVRKDLHLFQPITLIKGHNSLGMLVVGVLLNFFVFVIVFLLIKTCLLITLISEVMSVQITFNVTSGLDGFLHNGKDISYITYM